jgi:hypothetical protein
VPIHVSPSPTPGALRNGIAQAIAQNDQLILDTGTHLTNPHSSEWIQVPATGLRITSQSTSPRSLIKRPDNGLDNDNQYGLAFIPSPPSTTEIAAAQWKRAIDGQRIQSFAPGPDPCHPVPTFGAGHDFEYEIVVRGDIVIESVDLDCNMQNQPLGNQKPGQPWEHSAMLAFAGHLYNPGPNLDFGTSPDGVPRRFYVGFNSVSISGMVSHHGGTADDIWITRGFFHPNIERVVLNGIQSVDRVNRKRATVGFSMLAANVAMRDCDLFSLHLEDDERWDLFPRQTPEFQKASMRLVGIKSQLMALGSKGFVLNLAAQGLNITEAFAADQVSGSIVNSTIHKGTDGRMGRLDMTFSNVAWFVPVLATTPPQVGGLRPIPRFGEPCRAIFQNNTFFVEGALPANAVGALIGGEAIAPDPNVSGNEVFLSFQGCSYDPKMGSAAFPNTHIAHPIVRGTWTFNRADLNGLPLDRALLLPAPHTSLKEVLVLVF